MIFVIGTSVIVGCAPTPTTDRPVGVLSEYEFADPAPASPRVSIPSDPEPMSGDDGALCFDRDGVETWVAISRFADTRTVMAEANRDIVLHLGDECRSLLAAGIEAERQAQEIWDQYAYDYRLQWYEIWGWRVLFAVVAAGAIR